MSGTIKIAFRGATSASKLAVYKCFVAAALSDIAVQAVESKTVKLALPTRLPTLVAENGLQIFGANAICKYLGASGKKKLEDSLAGADWIEFEDKLQMKFDADKLEERLSKLQESDNQSIYLGKSIGVADVCLACTLTVAKENGTSLGPVATKWLDALTSNHSEFGTCLAKADQVMQSVFSHLEHAESQSSSIIRAIREGIDAAIGRAIPGDFGALSQASVTEANFKAPCDFQSNNAMLLFKSMKALDPSIKSPMDIAAMIEKEVKKESSIYPHIICKTGVAKPGMVELYLNREFVAKKIKRIFEDEKLKAPFVVPCKVGVDFSSPNAAKEMHVGHLRSTVIGESLCRIFEFANFEVKRINHIGDWGTQFGMLLTYMRHEHPNFLKEPPSIGDLDSFYRAARQAFNASDEFKEESRLEVVKLQAGDKDAIAGWKQFLSISEEMLFQVYRRLGVTFPDGLCGESFYNSRIPAVVEELTKKGMIVDEDGAKCVFTKAIDIPLFIQKRDGGYGYDSTDMAALKYRIQELDMKWIVYVTDLGQQDHFFACFEAAETAGWTENVRLDHVGFGVVQGKDRQRFKTRDGGTVRLVDLLDEAVDRAKATIIEKLQSPDAMTEEEIQRTAEKVGYSAVKYFDLKNSRERDYVFDYNEMLSATGDTAVYLTYGYARVCSIERTCLEHGINPDEYIAAALPTFRIDEENPTECQLADALLKFPDCFLRALEEQKPHHVAGYIYGLVSVLSKFYGKNYILDRDEEGKRTKPSANIGNWLILLRAAKYAMRDASYLVGLEPVERL